MCIVGLAKDARYRFCQREEETPEYNLCYCEGLDRLRLLQIGEEKPTANRDTKKMLSKLWCLIKRIKLNNTL